METVSGASNWKLVFRREGGGVTILRAGTPDVRAVLPERLFGLPVTALGDRALAPERRPSWSPAAPRRRSGTTAASRTWPCRRPWRPWGITPC